MILKAYLKLIPSYIGSVVMYIGIFIALISMLVNADDGISSGSGSVNGFTSLVSVQDMDNSEESRALRSYLENSPNMTLVDIDFSRENAAQDSLYYRKTEYVLTIKEGFGEKLKAGITEGLLASEVVSGTTSEMFVGNEIDSYMSAVKLYIAGGYDSVSACAEAARVLEKGVPVTSYKQEQGWDEENKAAYYFYNYIPYVMIMMILGILIPSFTSFFNDEMRSRTLCAPVSPAAYMLQVTAGALAVCIGTAAVLTLAGISITGGTVFHARCGYSLLQMFIFMLFCLALSALVGILCSGRKKAAAYVTSIVSNILGLGMSFLCGVFVKQSLLGSEILNFGKLFPAYWYVRGNNMILGGDGQVFDKDQTMLCILVQLLFALAVFAAALLAASLKKGKRSDK